MERPITLDQIQHGDTIRVTRKYADSLTITQGVAGKIELHPNGLKAIWTPRGMLLLGATENHDTTITLLSGRNTDTPLIDAVDLQPATSDLMAEIFGKR